MRRFFIFFVYIFIFQSSFSQSFVDSFYLQRYDNTYGLSNSSINKILTDRDELLWLATWDGFNMFDGVKFHVFSYSKKDDHSINSNVILDIAEDKNSNIWLTTIEGVSKYEKKSGHTSNFFSTPIQHSNLSEFEYKIAVDTQGIVYCYSQKYGLNYYDFKSQQFKKSNLSFKNDRVDKLLFTNDNKLLILKNNGRLNLYNGGLNQFNAESRISEDAENIFKINDRILFTNIKRELIEIEKNSKQKLLLKTEREINSLFFYQNHYLVAWNEGGCGTFGNEFQPSGFMKDILLQFANSKITEFGQSKGDILWLGTDGNGLIKIYPRVNSFGTVSSSEYGKSYNLSVRAFAEENGNLWVGTKGKGIIQYKDFWNNSKELFRQNFAFPKEIDNNSIYAIKRTKNNLLIIGSDGKGVSVYDISKRRFYKWNNIKSAENSPAFGSVYAIYEDTDSSLWIGTSGYGLIHTKIRRDKDGLSIAFGERFSSSINGTGPANDIIYSLTSYNEDFLWVGCRYGGLSLMNKKTRSFRNFKAFTYEGSLSNNDVLYTYKDSRNNLWVGTSYGLNFVDYNNTEKERPVFHKITTEQGLPNNTIHAITEDGSGNIWVSTNKGIARVTWPNLKIISYQQHDGLQNNEFSDGSVWKDEKNNIFFGGISGFNHFLPERIKKDENVSNLLISDITAGGIKEQQNSFWVFNSQSHSPALEILLERKSNYFDFNVNAINFINSEKCEYSYFLEGVDKSWQSGVNNGKVSYSNLLPGNYTLKMKWSNGEGQWSNEIVIMNARVKQYWWLTGYAIAFYSLLLALLGYMFYKYRRNRAEIKQKLEVEKLMRAKEEEIHENRIGFFTNIAHELQTPLTLITGGFERIIEKDRLNRLKDEENHYFQLIKQQASKLVYLLHQLFEFRKADAGYYKNQFTPVDISELLKNLCEPFQALAEKKDIEYTVDIQKGIVGEADKDKIEKIVFNLLSNAFKYTTAGKRVEFKMQADTDAFTINVFNSGAEITETQLKNLFEKFYTVDRSDTGFENFGTGIGLAFTRQLITLLKGSITANNENGGVNFSLKIPMGAEENGEEKLPVSDQPSQLYKAITTFNEVQLSDLTVKNNKEAVMENIINKEKDILVIVDDEADIRYLLRDLLNEDYIVYEAEDGKKGLDLINKHTPNLIISDILMPYMNGLELCQRVKTAPATCHIPIILLSAKSAEEQHIEGYEAGADAYISKPFNTRHLKIRVKKLIQYQKTLQNYFQKKSPLNGSEGINIRNEDKEFLNAIFRFIETNIIDPDLSASAIEKELNLSKMQLYRKLKTLTGMTPNELIKNIRLQKAEELLLSSKMPVLEIFYSTGFNNQSYFFREFKKKYNYAPNEYREKQKP